MSNAEGKIISQGDAITRLTNDVSVIDGKVNQKADTSAVTSLATRVTAAEGAITSQATALTQLQSGLTDANGRIGANSTAISNLKTEVTAIDGRVTSNSQSITGLNSTLSNLRIGGTNLLPNSGTLAGVSGVVAGETYKGNAIKRLSVAAASSAAYDQFEYSVPAPFDGTEVVMSFCAKAKDAAATQLVVYLYNPNATLTALTSQGKTGSWANGGDGSMTIDITTTWTRYWIRYTRKAGQTGSSGVIFGRLMKGAVDREAYISSPKLEYGTVPTEWSEAPADNASASALQGLTTRVTAAEGNITANTTAISNLTSRVGNADASIDGLNETVAANGLAMANGFQQMRAQVGDVQASITTTNKAMADLKTSTAEQITQVNSSVGDMSATVQTVSETVEGTVYANRIEGDIGAFAINIAQHRSRNVPKATWQWFELLRIRRQNFDQVVNLKGALLQSDRIGINGGGLLRAGMSYASGSDGGLDPGYLSYAILMKGTGATSGSGTMELGIECAYETGGAFRIATGQESLNLENLTFTVGAGTGDAVIRYGCYLDRNGQMVCTIVSRFDAFVARNNGVVRGASTP